jgi:hypothetical protein
MHAISFFPFFCFFFYIAVLRTYALRLFYFFIKEDSILINCYLLEIGSMNLVLKNVRRKRLKESAQSKKGVPDIFLKETNFNSRTLQKFQTNLILIFFLQIFKF